MVAIFQTWTKCHKSYTMTSYIMFDFNRIIINEGHAIAIFILKVYIAKLNFKVSFPPAYKRRVWDFSRANIPAIQQAITGINWNSAFIGLNIDERVSFLTDCVLNVFQNFIPNMVITVRNKDAVWMTPEIKKMIIEKAKIYRRYVKHGRNAVDYLNLRDITARCRTLIKKAKDGYFSRLGNTLNNPDIGPKKYWSILHCFLNKRKTPKIPPIRHNNAIVTNITEKANIFNIFFCQAMLSA